jgi:hypothetical protein
MPEAGQRGEASLLIKRTLVPTGMVIWAGENPADVISMVTPSLVASGEGGRVAVEGDRGGVVIISSLEGRKKSAASPKIMMTAIIRSRFFTP